MSFQLYLHFYGEDEYDDLTDETWVTEALRRMVELIDFADTEGNTKVYYDEKNISKFVDVLEYLFPPARIVSPSGQLRSALKSAWQWRPSIMQESVASYFQWFFDKAEALPESDNSLCEIAERAMTHTTEKFAILSPCTPKRLGRNYLALFKDKVNTPDLPQLKKFELLSDAQSLLNFFRANRIPRVFNLNPKHGENGVGNFPGASPLLCNRVDAQILLNNALGKSGTTELYNFDTAHNQFIVFKNENTLNNSYHAYHVSDEAEIPIRVKSLLI